YNGEANGSPKRLGLIAEEAPDEVLSANKKGVDVYKLATFILAGVQEQQKRLEGLETRITALERRGAEIASSTPSQTTPSFVAEIATAVKDLIASAGEWTVSKITAAVGSFGTAKVENGLEMKDSATGATYCVRITHGEFAKVAGTCAENTTTPASGHPSSTGEGTGTDTVAPIITVNGNNPANVNMNSNYADLGASVTDNVSSNLGVKASLDNSTWVEVGQIQLDTANSTTYTIHYKATDNAGNIGTAERTVIVGSDAEVTSSEPSQETATPTPETTPTPEPEASPTEDTATSTPTE
ncbi:MAG: DUF5011 domain-containing protein, partial [Candidatus Taylorbacteria bacterium]|nr:DUF5011 domain-containing protein [Candidatus Taylorbacteria bacterium]